MNPEIFAIQDRLKAFPPAHGLYILYRRITEHGLRVTWLWIKDKLQRLFLGSAGASITEVAPGVFVGGQHRRRGLRRMRAMGISAVVNMREESDDAVRGVALDHYLWLPTPDDHQPEIEAMHRGAEFIARQRAAGKGVYIHCASGVGRAPTMAAAYLVSIGLDPDQAWETIRQGRPFVRPTPAQVEVICAFAEDKR